MPSRGWRGDWRLARNGIGAPLILHLFKVGRTLVIVQAPERFGEALDILRRVERPKEPAPTFKPRVEELDELL